MMQSAFEFWRSKRKRADLIVHLVHVTDLHFGCEDAEALDIAASYIDQIKPDVVIVTGDISKDGRKRELERACAWMRELTAPVMLTPGNHDVPYYNPFGRVFYPWRRFRNAAHGVRTEAWHTPNWSIVPINTARGVQLRWNWAQGAVSAAQVDKAANELAAAAPGALRLVITHHPLIWPNDAPIHGGTLGGPQAQATLTSAGANVFLSGHLHGTAARPMAGALTVSSGTLSKRVRHEPCSFSAIRRTAPDEVEVEALFVVQGRAETASSRRFKLEGQAFGASAETPT